MFKYLAISLTALTVASAFPLHPRSPPPYRSCDYLEEYDTYLARFNALDCGSKASADVEFYVECCYPLHKTESLADKPARCTPPPPPSDTIAAEPPAETGAPAPAPEAPANPAPAPPSGGNDGGDNGNGGGDGGYNGNPGNGGGDNGNPGNGGGGDDDDDEDCTEEPETPSSTSAPEPSEAPANPAPEPSEAPSSEAPAPSDAPEPAPEPSSSEPAPPQETQPPSGGDGNVHTGGFATFFYQNGNAGACGERHSDDDLIAAISEEVYGYDYSKKSDQCGKRVRVTNNNNGKTVEVVIVDSCPTCVNRESLDLSHGAFTSIAAEADGMVPITWEYI